MIVLRNRPKEGCEALGLGVFDGLHLGHQEIIKQCSHVLSFDPHPDQLLNKNRKIKLLTTVQERECLFPRIVTLTFTRAIATLRAHQFLNEVVLKELSPKRMVVGYDFKFGYKKEGDLTVLKAWEIGRAHV